MRCRPAFVPQGEIPFWCTAGRCFEFKVAEKVIFLGMLKNAPACAEASAGRQMQVELCEIPLAGALEILRSEAYLDVRCNDLPC
jgi:hypothetical protein